MIKARLIELVNDDFSPNYEFLDYKSFEGDNEGNSKIELLTYKNGEAIEEKVIRETAFNLLKNGGISRIASEYQDDEKAKERILELREELVDAEIKYWHNPFSKRYWKSDGAIKLLIDGITLSSGIVGFREIENSPIEGLGALAIGLLAKGMSEYIRRSNKKGMKGTLSDFKESLSEYQNFRSNIAGAQIKTLSPEGTQKIYDDLKKQNLGKYSKVNSEEVNKDLMEIYREVDA